MPAITPDNPLALTLTAEWMAQNALVPVYAGVDWTLRLQVRDHNDVAVSLSGATIAMDVRRKPRSAVVFSRVTGVEIDTGRDQIDIDADQSAEDTANETGRGWMTIRISDEDETEMLTAIGSSCNSYLMYFDVRILFASGDHRIAFAGTIEFLRPVTLAEAV